MISATNNSIASVYCIASSVTCSEIDRLMKELSGCSLIGFANDAQGAIPDLINVDAPVILIQHDPPKRDANTVISQLRSSHPRAKFIVLLSEENQFWTALTSKADSYLIWPTSWLAGAIDIVSRGGVWLGPYITQYLLQGDGYRLMQSISSSLELPKSLELLSNREREVLKLLLDGMTNKEIADELNLRLGTVKVHVNHILSKLQVEHRSQAIAKLTRLRLVN